MKKSIKSLFVMMLSLIMMLSISLVSFAEEIALRIMATTDLHTSFTNYNYYTDAVNEQAGFVKIATLINKNKDEMKGNTLLFDNGDMLQGSPYGDYMAKNFNSKKEIYPMIEAMNLLGYDAATLGNHEFNYGLDYLNSVIKDAKFSYVSSNLYKNNEKDNYMKPYVILNKTFKDTEGKDVKVKVGVIGFLPPQIMMWDAANLTGKVSTKGILDTAKKYIPQMKKEGADIIIALAHTGMGGDVAGEKGEIVGYQLPQIDGIDAVVSGHSHVTFPSKSYTGMAGVDIANGTVNGKPYVIAGSLGDALGVMDVVIDKVNNKWVVKSGKSSIQSVYDKVTKKAIENNKEVELIFDKGHKGTLDYIRGAIGETKSAIFSFLALGQDDSSIQLVNTAQKWYVEQKVKGTELEKLPILSAAAPFKAGGRMGVDYFTNIPVGTLAIKNMADLYVYPNTLYVLKLKGSDVKEWLEMSAGQFNTIDPNKDEEQMLVNEVFPTYNFDVIDGVSYEIDVTKAPRYDKDGKLINVGSERISNLKYNGKIIDMNAEFLVATNNYRASGGGNFPGINASKAVIASPDENRQVIVNYIKTLKIVDPKADGNWKFKKVEGNKAKVILLSSPLAKDLVGENLQYLGEGPNGYVKYLVK